MPPPAPRKLQPGDILYRKLEPGTFDPESGEVADEAFVDGYDNQSFFVDHKKSPREVLEFFAGMKSLRDRFGKPDLTADDLIEEGFGVAKIEVSEVTSSGFEIIKDEKSNGYNKNGHVDIKELKERPWLISGKAKALDKQSLVNKKSTEKNP